MQAISHQPAAPAGAGWRLDSLRARPPTKLTDRYRGKLPADLKLRIVNPSGLIISGRDDDLTEGQRADFEIFRRQNRNVVDVVTYDDLLWRLDRVIKQLKAGQEAGPNGFPSAIGQSRTAQTPEPSRGFNTALV